MGAILKQRKDLRTAKTLEEIELELWGGHGCLGGCNTVGVYNLCTGKKGCHIAGVLAVTDQFNFFHFLPNTPANTPDSSFKICVRMTS